MKQCCWTHNLQFRKSIKKGLASFKKTVHKYGSLKFSQISQKIIQFKRQYHVFFLYSQRVKYINDFNDIHIFNFANIGSVEKGNQT